MSDNSSTPLNLQVVSNSQSLNDNINMMAGAQQYHYQKNSKFDPESDEDDDDDDYDEADSPINVSWISLMGEWGIIANQVGKIGIDLFELN